MCSYLINCVAPLNCNPNIVQGKLGGRRRHPSCLIYILPSHSTESWNQINGTVGINGYDLILNIQRYAVYRDESIDRAVSLSPCSIS